MSLRTGFTPMTRDARQDWEEQRRVGRAWGYLEPCAGWCREPNDASADSVIGRLRQQWRELLLDDSALPVATAAQLEERRWQLQRIIDRADPRDDLVVVGLAREELAAIPRLLDRTREMERRRSDDIDAAAEQVGRAWNAYAAMFAELHAIESANERSPRLSGAFLQSQERRPPAEQIRTVDRLRVEMACLVGMPVDTGPPPNEILAQLYKPR